MMDSPKRLEDLVNEERTMALQMAIAKAVVGFYTDDVTKKSEVNTIEAITALNMVAIAAIDSVAGHDITALVTRHCLAGACFEFFKVYEAKYRQERETGEPVEEKIQ